MGDYHQTNGCVTAYYVHGVGQVRCSHHAGTSRDEVLSYRKPGAVQAKRPAYSAVGPRGVWSKRATWRKGARDDMYSNAPSRTDCGYARLDALAHVKVAPASAMGVLIRRKVK